MDEELKERIEWSISNTNALVEYKEESMRLFHKYLKEKDKK